MNNKNTENINLPSVAVMFLVYNSEKELLYSIDSFRKNTFYPNVTLYAIDNNSEDNSVEFLETRHPDFKIIKMHTNLGYARAYNQAIQQVDDRYVVFLNPDLVFTPGWLTKLVNYMESDPMLFIVGAWPVWRKYKNMNVIPCWNNMEYNAAICGAAMMVRKQIFLKLGGFEEEYFLYSEDVELSYRANLMGYKTAYLYDAMVFHGKDHDGESFNGKILYEIQKNRLNVILRYFRGYHLIKELSRGLFYLARDMKKYPLHRNDCIKGALWNLKNIQNIMKFRKKTFFSSESYAKFYELLQHDRLKDQRHEIFFRALEKSSENKPKVKELLPHAESSIKNIGCY